MILSRSIVIVAVYMGALLAQETNPNALSNTVQNQQDVSRFDAAAINAILESVMAAARPRPLAAPSAAETGLQNSPLLSRMDNPDLVPTMEGSAMPVTHALSTTPAVPAVPPATEAPPTIPAAPITPPAGNGPPSAPMAPHQASMPQEHVEVPAPAAPAPMPASPPAQTPSSAALVQSQEQPQPEPMPNGGPTFTTPLPGDVNPELSKAQVPVPVPSGTGAVSTLVPTAAPTNSSPLPSASRLIHLIHVAFHEQQRRSLAF
ncbi:hypothetical protein BCR43DRAFT_508289 [Syncephalastrum racemosum]|uniref:Uncharacterized protein n=1 Tax=Syncephalastrum racemosum TaxID=13706 RepID=A0A1X2H323_SYNRA|nr:hypothetical protein BCR43DRAFT_508289 [Syncephalastrum racemosum]